MHLESNVCLIIKLVMLFKICNIINIFSCIDTQNVMFLI